MKTFFSSIVTLLLSSWGSSMNAQTPALVDFDAYEKLVAEVKVHRQSHLVTAAEFKKLSTHDKVIILDTRSDSMFAIAHIKGAVHLNFSDFTQAMLDSIIPSREYKILIYCNNNFNIKEVNPLVVVPKQFKLAMATKSFRPEPTPVPGLTVTLKPEVLTLALNIPTYINLYGYGYKNVYELSELVNTFDGIIELEGTAVK